MLKRCVALLLIAVSLFQAASATGLAQACLAQDTELVHLALHWQGEGHHHHEDGSIHTDDSPEAVQHAMADCSMHHPGLIVALPLASVDLPSQRVAAPLLRQPPSPYLDGLQRPPQSLS